MSVTKTLDFSKCFYELVQQNLELLNDLDNAIGDGDHGSNLLKGLEYFKVTHQTKSYTSEAEIWKDLAMSFLAKVGGASGPLYGSAFLAMAKVVGVQNFGEVLVTGSNQIKVLGKSDLNQKTMLDVWIPATSLYQAQKLTVAKIDELVEKTKLIPAIKGRASYLGERALGHIDPGSYSTGLMFKAILQAGL
ncbi:dihydroxyacetone kinase, L subunit [Spiroplasma clarkii]|uniref:Dihydroxyacetone kinase, C-terminal domain n=1 Tax=Spiroplasma clarkii TaxID=2139 RepID=A0A1Y0L1W5_9MOLU|nr:dihydroxyacetone kinase subunit DhaL [Spiroplasma clarkii]ARU91725.1 dihydroxyacetone kinase, L subunit [Spiroplasma clarkii]ATX71108.1 dihydroxyacetone kinase, C-terminal domain [Spiroplasma clarkii]